MRFLFIVGCPRSGTSALTYALNAHPDVVLGLERFNSRIARRVLQPQDFDRPRFFDVQPDDTWYRSLDQFKDYYENVAAKYDSGLYRGDKFPRGYEHYEYLSQTFADSYFIFILRNIFDVAESFEARRVHGGNWPANGGPVAAVQRWNASIGYTLRWRERTRILIVAYEDLFIRDGSATPIAAFLGIDPNPLDAALARARTARPSRDGPRRPRLSPEHAEHISRHANFIGFRQLLGVNPPQRPAGQMADIRAPASPLQG